MNDAISRIGTTYIGGIGIDRNRRSLMFALTQTVIRAMNFNRGIYKIDRNRRSSMFALTQTVIRARERKFNRGIYKK
jgi:hypothetical protein